MHTDDYGQQRTETDNTDDRPAGVQNKPYLHKPRKRHYPQTTSRLSGVQPDDRRSTAARRNSTKLPLACWASAQRQAQKPANQGAISRRYSRVLQVNHPGSVLPYVTRMVNAARLARASEIAPLSYHSATTPSAVLHTGFFQEWPTAAAARTLASLTEIPRPGNSLR